MGVLSIPPFQEHPTMKMLLAHMAVQAIIVNLPLTMVGASSQSGLFGFLGQHVDKGLKDLQRGHIRDGLGGIFNLVGGLVNHNPHHPYNHRNSYNPYSSQNPFKTPNPHNHYNQPIGGQPTTPQPKT